MSVLSFHVTVAGYLGQKKQDDANTTVTHGLLLAFGIGALLNHLALLIMKPYFRAFTNNEEIYQLSIAYMSVCSFMQIPNMVHIAIQKMIQATGNMVAPMWFQIAGVVVNFVFDPILIFGIGIFPAMGIRGAAVATVAGYLLSMILAFALLLGKKQKVQVKIKGFHLKKQMIHRIFAFGLPSFIMNALSSFIEAWIVAAFDKSSNSETIENPWESVISRKKTYHDIRVRGSSKNLRNFAEFAGVVCENWSDVTRVCRSLQINLRITLDGTCAISRKWAGNEKALKSQDFKAFYMVEISGIEPLTS